MSSASIDALPPRQTDASAQAGVDALTGLADFGTAQLDLAAAVERCHAASEPLSLAMIDIDRLKILNDLFGMENGDEALRRLAAALDDRDAGWKAFRTDGDGFAALIPGIESATAKTELAARLRSAQSPGLAVSFTSAVATLRASDGADPSLLWERAAAALGKSKRTGRGQIVDFDEIAKAVTVVTPGKVKAVRSLLEKPRLETAFQPIWDLESDRLLGMEALARPWRGYGFDGPSDMFVIAEQIGRAHELDAICVAATIKRAPELPAGCRIFLNINPLSLVHDSVTADTLVDQLSAVGIPPSQVVLEITEQSDARLDVLTERTMRLADAGFKIAIDDVGSGNAGLQMLCQMPVDFIKLDFSVISQLTTSVQARAVLISIALLAFRVDAYVIAEGIETPEVLEFLRNAHHLDIMRDPPITGAQGYLLGRPQVDLAGTPSTISDALAATAPPMPARLPLPDVGFADAA